VGVLIKKLVFSTILSLARPISPDIGRTSINRFVRERSIAHYFLEFLFYVAMSNCQIAKL